MSGITKNPEMEHKIKRLVDHTLNRMILKHHSPLLHAGFEMFRNEIIMQLKHENLNFEDDML